MLFQASTYLTSTNIPLDKASYMARCRESGRTSEVMAKFMTTRRHEKLEQLMWSLYHTYSLLFLLLGQRKRAHLIRNLAWFNIGGSLTIFSFMFKKFPFSKIYLFMVYDSMISFTEMYLAYNIILVSCVQHNDLTSLCITKLSLQCPVTICHHTKLTQYWLYSIYYTLHPHDLFIL